MYSIQDAATSLAGKKNLKPSRLDKGKYIVVFLLSCLTSARRRMATLETLKAAWCAETLSKNPTRVSDETGIHL